MIVVDTSVGIDLFRDAGTWQVEVLVDALEADEPVALTDVVLTGVLHGLRDERTVRRVEERLLAHPVLVLEPLDDHRRAAAMDRACRRRGVTIRRTLDCLVASVCVREDVPILHADADLDRLAAHTDLRVVAG